MTFDPAPATPAEPLPAPAAVVPRRRSSRLIDLALIGAAVLAIGGVAFAVGRATAPVSAATGFTPGGANIVRPGGSFDPGSGQGPRFAFGGPGGLTIDGTVTAIDADSITITTADGQQQTFDVDSSTAYHQATDAAASDVAVGDEVSVKVTGRGGGAGSQGAAPGASGDTFELSASDVTVTR